MAVIGQGCIIADDELDIYVEKRYACIGEFRKEYPKRATGVDSNTLGHHSGEGGARLTVRSSANFRMPLECRLASGQRWPYGETGFYGLQGICAS